MIPPYEKRPAWLKSRGYLHITPKIDVFNRYEEVYTKVNDPNFVARHGFFPLIHSVIKERKYKKLPNGNGRGHSYKKGNEYKKTAKLRPLHYATHIDAIIYGCYAEKLLKLYEDELKEYPGLSDCVIAYRKIEVPDEEEDNADVEESEEQKGKSTIHFAFEAFEEIKKRAQKGCVVLMFDIKSFFSELNHEKLKKAWCDLLKVERLDKANFNVFNAATNFRYILKDELRIGSRSRGKRNGFDEKKLAEIRKYQGIEAFFSSIEDFENAIKTKKLKVYKHPFVKDKKPVGIPQGLPISAVLANLYLLAFDKVILDSIVNKAEGYYRRYSDDIMIICKPEDADWIEQFVLTEIKKSAVEISEEKTEKFLFSQQQISPKINRITAQLLLNGVPIISKPLTYLGFEFYGYKTLIKSANLSKYYRRMISSVKRKAKRAKSANLSSDKIPAIFPRQLRRIYDNANLNKEKVYRKRKSLVKNDQGFYSFKFREVKVKPGSTYISYVRRASLTMAEESIKDQINKHSSVFRKAMARHLKRR
ncbi:Reverse transcriptase (RNA-dependent DNA polymerase) [Mucilaginibacter gossypiicola]|uniref:Reverse transcriptase (RNA-dependent DNA polymerase) n=1 Tax=Mucilaginibacter gossypiicola TaxID=551995 RepID=A0A1H8DA76_9SPHI|nr:reverse transcriptase domain-containing protein [Mucilaginibacter gossypiicola]SEN04193.1 Reverse transcriptase (RNA-dependent DNA polymerase) [Mucilaginibacter gossypiicola]